MITREERVKTARLKIHNPFTLDETLTFFCPQENLAGFNHPRIREFHRFIKDEYKPPVKPSRAIMLILPCVKSKPYSTSEEHRIINNYLLSQGFQPTGTGDCPLSLERSLLRNKNPLLLNNSVIERDDLFIHRFVISEPMALVPLPEKTPKQIQGYFTGGGKGITPLVLPEMLEILGHHLDCVAHGTG